jgi:hypothetical protein
MEKYRYQCAASLHFSSWSRYDAEVYATVSQYVYPRWRKGLLATHRAGDVQHIQRQKLLDDGRELLAELMRGEEKLQFRYTLRVALSSSERHERVEKHFDCVFDGKKATAFAGAGTAVIEQTEYNVIDASVAAAYVREGKMRPEEAHQFVQYPGKVPHSRRLHDLRDLLPVRTDNGYLVRAVRKAQPTRIIELVRELVEFLDKCADGIVEVEYLGSGSHF